VEFPYRCSHASDALESNQLFHLLPQAHRDRFLAALRNPESEDAKELLRSATERSTVDGGEGETIPMPEELPWWEAPDVSDEDAPPYALPPCLASEGITRDIKPPEGTGVKLAYNALAIWSVTSRPIAPAGCTLTAQPGVCPHTTLVPITIALSSPPRFSSGQRRRSQGGVGACGAFPSGAKVDSAIRVRARCLGSSVGSDRKWISEFEHDVEATKRHSSRLILVRC
jgi:hypothetical protein